MKVSSVPRLIIQGLKSITVEPVIFFFLLGMFILNGAQVPTNILVYKVCHYEMNFTESICENLGDEANKDIEQEVRII